MKQYKFIFLSGLDIWSIKEGFGAPSFYNTLKLYVDKGCDTVLIKPTGKRHKETTINGMRLVSFNNDFWDNLERIRKVSFFGRILSQWHKNRMYRKLAAREIESSEKPCVLYAYEVTGVKAAKVLSHRYHIPFITRFQGTVLCEIKDTLFNRIRWYPHFGALSQDSDLVIMTDDGTFGKKVLENLGNNSKEIVFWRNGVDFNVDETADLKKNREMRRREWGVNDNDFVFLTLCRLVKWKRIDRSIKAFKEIVNDCPKAKLVIVGEGDMQDELAKLVQAYGICDKVVFAGGVQQNKTWECYNAADVFLSLNDLGNVGNPLFEALFWGKPIITLNNGDTSSVIQNEYNAIMISPEEEYKIPTAMKTLIEDNSLRNQLSNNALEYANENLWTWKARMEEEFIVVSKTVENYYERKDNNDK